MKARVKGTNNIIDVEFNKDALNACYPPYYDKEHGMYYQPEQLEWVDNEENAKPDYWTCLEHQYAGMAMQGFCANYNDFTKVNDGTCTNVEMICENARIIAHALVEKARYEENPKELEGLKKGVRSLEDREDYTGE